MPASLVVAPQYPIPGRECTITFSGLASGTDKIQLFPVSAPVGSALRESIDASKGVRTEIHSGPAGVPWKFAPEVGGVYTFTLQETSIQPAAGSLFQNDTTGAPLPQITQSGQVVLYVGEAMQLTLGESPDEVTLKLYVWNDTVMATSVAVHDEDTPALIEPTSPTADSASYDEELLETVGLLVGKTGTQIAGTLAADFATVRDLYQAHAASVTAHTNNDDVNTISDGWTATNDKTAAAAINELRSVIAGHTTQLEDLAEAEIHSRIDGETAFFASGAGASRGSKFFALADALVRLRDHADLSGPHASVVAVAGAVGPLTDVHVKYIKALQKGSPDSPDARNPGASILGALGGFEAAEQ